MKSVSEMTNDEFFKFVVEQQLQGWIPLKAYMRLFPEETRNAIEIRIKRGFWRRGVHYNTPKGSNSWVNLIAIRQWVEQGQQSANGDPDNRLASRSAPDTLG